MAKVVFAPNLTDDDTSVVSHLTLKILSECADKSNNPTITITSTLRTPYRQALAMYNNLANEINIRYAWAGQQVISVYQQLSAQNMPKTYIVEKMTNKIEELSKNGYRVSKHCVSLEEYAKLNIIDISKNIPNPRDMARELAKLDYVEKIITPIQSNYDSGKISYDKAEPAIHIEVKQQAY